MKKCTLAFCLFFPLLFSGLKLFADPCTANYDFSATGYYVAFTDGSYADTTIMAWAWNFGDGSTSNLQNPTHTYATAGTYEVCLTIYTADACFDNKCETITITAADCLAAFTFAGDPTVAFTDLSTSAVAWLWDFGDGTTSSLENPTHTYAVSGTYNVCLTIGNGAGCYSTHCDTLVIDGIVDCYVNFDFTVDGSTASFTTTTFPGPGDVVSYSWTFGDGTTSDAANPTHTYADTGTYWVCVIVVFTDGCTNYHCENVEITATDCNVTAEVLASDSLDFHFIATVTPPADEITYTWSFGDGTSYTETTTGDPSDPYHSYDSAGVYTVCVEIITGTGCTDYYCFEVEAIGPDAGCEADFIYDVDGMLVHFYETATGEVTSYTWNFGDGTTSTEANPTHEYTSPGVYNVCLTITTATGCVDYICKEITITAGGGDCESHFEFTADGLTVDFFENAYAGGGDIIYYLWDFGDGTTSTEENPTHNFPSEGTYTVCLQIYTSDSCSSIFCEEITVDALGGGACEAYFTVTSVELTPDGWVVDFTNESVADGDIISVTWTFGDGGTATTYDATHTYLAPGDYTICIVISSDSGCVDEYCDVITVGDGGGTDCVSDFDWTTDGLLGAFTETADGGGADITSYSWTFGDGGSSTAANPFHNYPASGTYEVCLTIVTSDSCTSTHCETIVVEGAADSCNASFEVESITEADSGWVVVFTNTSSGSDNYYWSFGDGSTSTDENPTHEYAEPGIYTVCLTIGEEGTDCFDEYCMDITIGGDDPCVDETLINMDIECFGVYDPVCGCNGVTYENECEAYYHNGIMFWTTGACGTAVEEENIFGNVSVYPNPAHDQVSIKYTLVGNADVKIELLDIISQQAKEIFNQHSVAGFYNYQLNTSMFAPGIYFVKITADQQSTVLKLVISK